MEEACFGKIALILTLLTLAACSSQEREDKDMLLREGNWLGEAHYFERDRLEDKFSSEMRDQKLPQLGLALAGGGTKASAFSIGVMQGLTTTGLIEKVDAISNVSGGGYAALWYYARMQFDSDETTISADGHVQMAAFFKDCLPTRYWKENNIKDSRLVDCPSNNYTNNFGQGHDPYLYQNALRGFQDVFSTDPGLFYSRSFNYKTTGEDNRFAGDVITLAGSSILVAPVGLVINAAFDWERDISVTQDRYNRGIARAYAGGPKSCDQGGCEIVDRAEIRRTGNTEQGKTLSFEDLKNSYHFMKAPLWIINATTGENRSPLNFSPQADINISSFEITPYGSGSGLYGYKNTQLDGITPYRATVASAAFLDSQQKVLLKPPMRNLAAMLMDITTFSWGTSYRNNFSAQSPEYERVNYWFHMALPWPLYYFHRFSPSRDSVFVHLSDGGQSENLGAYALIRRGIPAIIISDHAQDRPGQMGDICRLKTQLAKQDLRLSVPGLSDLQGVCTQRENGYDIYNWQYPVLLGCISNSDVATDSCLRNPEHPPVAGDYFSRLFIIKPSLANPQMAKALHALAPVCRSGISKKCGAEITKWCSQPIASVKTEGKWEFLGAPSCETLGFMMRNIFDEKQGIASDGCPHFPQHTTAMMTSDSSPWMYGAMRDLGAYYASQIKWFFNHTDGHHVDEKRFNEVVLDQQAKPLQRGNWGAHAQRTQTL